MTRPDLSRGRIPSPPIPSVRTALRGHGWLGPILTFTILGFFIAYAILV